MPRKKRSSANSERDTAQHHGLPSWLDSVLELLRVIIKSQISESVGHFASEARRFLLDTEQRLLQKLFSALAFFLALLFLIAAIVFLFAEYFGLSLGWSLLLLGVLLLILSWALRISSKQHSETHDER